MGTRPTRVLNATTFSVENMIKISDVNSTKFLKEIRQTCKLEMKGKHVTLNHSLTSGGRVAQQGFLKVELEP